MSLEESRSDWDILREILQADMEAWDANITERELRFKLETDLRKQQSLQNDMAILSIYKSACEHYLDVMASIDAARDSKTVNETVQAVREVMDGGTQEPR